MCEVPHKILFDSELDVAEGWFLILKSTILCVLIETNYLWVLHKSRVRGIFNSICTFSVSQEGLDALC